MFIERLTLKNFKSFGDEHQLALAKGFTAIVGPNGSGKSNILDGLRWVLGEANPSRLRINRQNDLIFQGSAGKAAATEAQVSLLLTDGKRNRELLRKLDSVNGSILTADGTRIRLQDLWEFKQDCHLEGDRFAFIGQGEINNTVSQRPLQRRLHLEELFGIDQYRRKRDEALAEIKQASIELERLLTLLSELQSRKEEIAPFLGKAKKAKDILDKLEIARKKLYFLRRQNEEIKLKTLSSDLEEFTKSAISAEFWEKLWAKHLQNVKNQSSAFVSKESDLNEQLEGIKPKLDYATLQVMEGESSIYKLDYSIDRSNEDVKKNKSLLETEEPLRDKASSSYSSLISSVSELENQYNDLIQKKERALALAEERKQERENLTRQEAKSLEDVEVIDGRLKAMAMSDSDLKKRLDKYLEEKEAIVTELTKEDEILEELEERLEEAEIMHQAAERDLQEISLRMSSMRKNMVKQETEYESALQTAEEGMYPKPVQIVTSAIKLGKLEMEASVAIEAFDSPKEYAIAFEAFLGARQYWIFVDDPKSAQKGIELLKNRNGGRATFLPLSNAKGRRLQDLPKGGGVIGWAIDLITPKQRWHKCVEHLFGNLLVVKDYDTASNLYKNANYSIVTLEGEVFSPSGTISGGKTAHSSGAITARNNLLSMEKEIEALREFFETLKVQYTELEKQEVQKAESRDRIRRDYNSKKETVDTLSRRLKDVQEELSILNQESSSSKLRAQELTNAKERANKSAQEARGRLQSLILDSEDENIDETIYTVKTQYLVEKERLASSKSELERIVKSVMELRSSLAKSEGQLQELSREKRLTLDKLASDTALKEDLEKQQRQVSQSLSKLANDNKSLSNKLNKIALRAQKSKLTLDDIKTKMSKTEDQMEKAKWRIDELCSTYEEKYPYDPDDSSILEDESLDKVESNVRYLDRSLKETGDVDLGVLSEDQSLESRIGYLDEQLSDVKASIEQLQDLVAQTDAQAGVTFMSSLENVDAKFNQLFQRLFGGGEAHLKAQEDMPLWECGVEIVARPPGKKLLFLAQLSGGEQSLTALSLLFSAMEVATVPLAVLDEVDAALDEVNLTRFAEMVHDYSTRLQIIAMTHRRQTMEKADIMYGVTMSEPGLSQIISVKVDQWQ